MLKRSYLSAVARWEWLLAAVLLLLGAALRLGLPGALPYGLNQDEASAGYEAYALLISGRDRCGDAWPVLFTSWGSGQNVLMSYLSMPFIAVGGLTETALRLPNAISGCLTLPVFWRLARRARGKHFGLAALAVLALNPWHIMMSRWALESNQLPFFLLLGVWCVSMAPERPRAMLGAAAAFGLSLYAYGTAFFFLPLFLLGTAIRLRRTIRKCPGCFLAALGLFLLLAAPIALCQIRNALGLGPLRLFGAVTLPRLTEGRQAATSVLGGASAEENLETFLHILWTQNDGLPWNALPLGRGGIFYLFGLPFAVFGFFSSLFLRKDYPEESAMRDALACALLCGILIRGNINRLNLVWLPLIYFSAVGIYLLLRRLDSWAALPAAAMLGCFLLFTAGYRSAFGGGHAAFFPGLGGAIEYAAAQERGTVYVTDRVNQPYIFALFYTRTPPETFYQSVEYQDETAAFRAVERFDGFEFRDRDRAALLVLRRDEVEDYRVLAQSGAYVVCEPLE